MPFTDWESTGETEENEEKIHNSDDDYSSEDSDEDQENAVTPENFKSRDDGKPSPRSILRKLSKPMTDGLLTGDTSEHGDGITDEAAISTVNSKAKKIDRSSLFPPENTKKKRTRGPTKTTENKNCTRKLVVSDDESDSEDESASSAHSSDSNEEDAQGEGTVENLSDKNQQHRKKRKDLVEEEEVIMSSTSLETKKPTPLASVPEKSTTVSTSTTAGKRKGVLDDNTNCTESKSEPKSVPESQEGQSATKTKLHPDDIHYVILNDKKDTWERIAESSKIILGKALVCEEPNDPDKKRNLLDDLKEDDPLDLEWYFDIDGKRYIGYTEIEAPVVYLYPVSVKDEIAFWEQVCADVPFKPKQHKFQISMYLTLGELLNEKGGSYIARYLSQESICTTSERRILSHDVKCHMTGKSAQKNPKRQPPIKKKNETPTVTTLLENSNSLSQLKPSQPHQEEDIEPKYMGQRDHLNSKKETQEEKKATPSTLPRKRKRKADKLDGKQKQKKLVEQSLQEVTDDIAEREKGALSSKTSSDEPPSKGSKSEKRKRGPTKKKPDNNTMKKMKTEKILVDDTPQTDEPKRLEPEVDSRGKPQESSPTDTILAQKEISVADAMEALKKAADKLGYNVAIKFESKNLGSIF